MEMLETCNCFHADSPAVSCPDVWFSEADTLPQRAPHWQCRFVSLEIGQSITPLQKSSTWQMLSHWAMPSCVHSAPQLPALYCQSSMRPCQQLLFEGGTQALRLLLFPSVGRCVSVPPHTYTSFIGCFNIHCSHSSFHTGDSICFLTPYTTRSLGQVMFGLRNAPAVIGRI